MSRPEPHETRLTPCLCPHCGALLDAASDLGRLRRRPNPGDVSLCIHCGGWMVFTDDLGLRAPTSDEACEIAASRECREMSLVWYRSGVGDMSKPPGRSGRA